MVNNMTPTKEMVLERAKEMFIEDSVRHGSGSTIDPEESELAEGGFLSAAKSELMFSIEKKNAQWMLKPEKPERNLPKIETLKENFFDVAEALDTGFFISGTSQCGKSNLAKILVKTLLDNGITVYVMDTSQAWNSGPIRNIVEVSRSKKEYAFGESTVFDLSALALRDKVMFVNETCKHVYRAHVDGYPKKEFIVFEECQSYLPNGSFRLSIRRNPIFEHVLDIVTVGANYGVRFGLITQFASMVDKAPVKNRNAKIFWMDT